MNKKLIFTLLAFALLAGVLSYWLMQNNTDDGFGVENKTVILQDGDNYSTTNAVSLAVFTFSGCGIRVSFSCLCPNSFKDT